MEQERNQKPHFLVEKYLWGTRSFVGSLPDLCPNYNSY
jgi:hypothetical protein